jgi:hypothetical protein
MKKQLFGLFLLLPLLVLSVLFPSPSYAATFRNGDTVTVEQTLDNPYVFGGTVTIEAPVQNDLTVAGGTVTINDRIAGGILAAGGTLNIEGEVGNSLRAAGGTIRITAPVQRDVVVAGGNITLDESASISGDLVVNGGTINVQSPVRGNIYVNGGQVTLNAPVGGSVRAEVGSLILGRQAVINGDLNYTANERATLRDGAVIRGQENFTQGERQKNNTPEKQFAGLFTGWALYKLIADILASLLLIYLLYRFTRRIVESSAVEPLKNGFIGFATLFLGPILGLLLLILILPGILTFLFYGVLLILAMFLGKLFAGYLLLRWWYGRENRTYILDWKAAIVGPVVMFLLLLIPVIGWFVGFVIYLIALGTLVVYTFSWISSPTSGRTAPAPATRTSRATPARPARRSAAVRSSSRRGR